jgi:hypothetical protein
MDYVDFMRKVEGKPPKPEVDTSKFWYTGDMLVNVSLIQEVLDGDCEVLHAAFTWDGTPQGYDHWDGLNDGFAHLTSADVEYLEWMLEEYS